MKNDIEIILNERGFTKETLAKALSVDTDKIDKLINEEIVDESLQSKIFHLAHGFSFEAPKDRLEEVVDELKNKYGLTQEQLCFYADVDEGEFKKFMNNKLIDRDNKVRIYSYLASLYHLLK